MTGLVVRAPAPLEGGQARVHVGEWASGTRFHERALELLNDALDAPGPECELLAAFEGATLRGVVVFGLVAGAGGAGRLLLLAGDRPEVARRLAADAVAALERRGARIVVAEWSDEPPQRDAMEWLTDAGWVERGRIPDLVADGVDVRVLLAPILPR